jgi:hypothetical protein
MFEPPGSPLIAGIHAVVAGGLLLLFGHLLVDALTLGRLHFVSKLALAFPAVVGWALVLMIAHMLSGGRVFSEPVAVRLVTLFAFAMLAGLRIYRSFKTKTDPERSRTYLWLLGSALTAGFVIMEWQVFRNFPLNPTPDVQLHAGWGMQLLAGESTPSATITGDVPNYYPWMFHALTAFVADLVPGRSAWFAFGPLQVLQVTGVVSALFALGRELTGRMIGGLGASFFGALFGGVGFVALRGIDYASNSREPGSDGVMKYLGDLITDRPYNASFYNLPGPLPRDIALALLASALFALACGCVRKSTGWFLTAGVLIGLIGLTGGESLLVGLSAGIGASLSGLGVPRLRALGAVLGPAVAIYALWLVPVLFNYFELGGFVDITHIAPVVLPPLGFLGAWALMVPFAIWGLILVVKRVRTDVRARVFLAVLVGALFSLVASSLIPAFFGDAFSTLETKHRYWPYVYLALALIAAYGFADLTARFLKKNVGGTALFVSIVVALGFISPLVAAVAIAREDPAKPLYRLVNSSLIGDGITVPEVLSESGPGECTVAVPAELSRAVFSFTGYRQVLWQGEATGSNRARIRWSDIYERIVPDGIRAEENTALVEGTTTQERWKTLVDKYGVDFVVVRAQDADRGTFSGYSSRPVRLPAPGYTVFDVGNC